MVFDEHGWPVDAALRCVLETVSPLGIERVPLTRARGRVLAEDLCASRDLPPSAVSMMDGYAVRSTDVATVPVGLAVTEEICAGRQPRFALAAGQCARIMTGAPLPAGADGVVRVEGSRRLSGDQVELLESASIGHHVRPQGDSMRAGDVVMQAGCELVPGAIGVLATLKVVQVRVHRLPRVAILSTGDELEALDAPVDPLKIPDANSYALMAQVQALGIEPDLLGIAPDEPVALQAALARGLEIADVLLVSGGFSVGEHDYVQQTLQALGVKQHFGRIAMRPGHPLMFGSHAGGHVFGLPGNPVSSMVCFELFVLPALRRLMGHRRVCRTEVRARLLEPIRTHPQRTEFVRVRLTRDDEGRWLARPTGAQGSALLQSMMLADGLLRAPVGAGGLAAGDEVRVHLLDQAVFRVADTFGEHT
ncbi:MAG: molybdenum cofactor biosynthesis protein [Candidatus Dactylopiibacterium carminicum]|uniref:Molybdopterin molybdenumtransferase n=1 Tax=Candidatus Dactylopiibacterium carminicum TaxID=857335 RepID=A0A272EX18_9RHOO|nr:gephyrin-like molybdotransferase Glp [Candidatus Dactylopiibacterium carminicum]KAF7600281.1 molybdopterin molybdenumtransferase MoeA [Candidatus Dactylopiibacterium carminicum]PAS94667.1 MAG: molybdenum cofactor biosynthesis protein [Candidatus Dactylopiibacterium carminicum]PAS96954.1 MAG: molybdenum cofactor biosynthesis protein [Candidatus Dactylopiibacterium carminicum]PAT00280.1 MAG: molybdenum cofactor biosynthesis protein [Candidatus Dactylopiibacterium carminicum]